MRRREFITLIGGAVAACPPAVRAQQPGGMRRIGVLMNGAATEAEPQSFLAAFMQSLHQLGWHDGQNIHVDVRWNAGDAALARIYAAQLIGLMPDLIVASSTRNLVAVREATSTVPVVFVEVSDPVAQGFVTSLTKPGGNITGFSGYEFSVASKWVELLKEVAPNIVRVAVMFNPDTSPQTKFFMRAIEASAPSLAVQIVSMPVSNSDAIEPAIETFAREPNGSLILPTDTFTRLRYRLIAETANHAGVPSMGSFEGFVKDGGLMFYGPNVDFANQYRQMAGYVDRILKGEKPADLPVQGPTKYELALNLKTAKALSLAIPQSLLATADEVIE
jgi:putative tryptophan/tyrosine transport system substrate-binding protein